MKKTIRASIIMIGIIISMAGSAMLISGSKTLNAFYDVGEVTDFPDSQYKGQVSAKSGYCDKDGIVHVTDENYYLNLRTRHLEKKANYLELNVSDLNVEQVDLKIEFYKTLSLYDKPTETIEVSMKDGLNSFDIDGMKFKRIRIRIMFQKDVTFKINKIQARENINVFQTKQFVIYAVAIMGIYLILVLGIYLLGKILRIKIQWYGMIDSLQDLYISVGNHLYNCKNKFLFQHRAIISSILFAMMMLYMTVVENMGIYEQYYKYHLVIYSFLILAIAFLNIEQKLKKRNWNNGLVFSWLMLGILMCISDFKVPKLYNYTGYILILIVGFLIFVWNNMEYSQKMIRYFMNGVHIYYVICFLFCIVCRPVGISTRYIGSSWNPSIFAICMITVLAVVLADFIDQVKYGTKSRKKLVLLLEGGSLIYLIFVSQSTGPLLTAGILLFLAFFVLVRMDHSMKIFHWIISILVIGIGVGITKVLLDYLPSILGTTYVMKRDLAYSVDHTSLFSINAHAMDVVATVKNTRIYQKVTSVSSITRLLSGRNYYYMAYIRQMNLWGHKNQATMFGGGPHLPHNSMIGIAFRYGVIAVVPYLLMLFHSVKQGWRYLIENGRYTFAPFALCLSTIIMSLSDNVERPFIWCSWIALYLMMGIGFNNHTEDKKHD